MARKLRCRRARRSAALCRRRVSPAGRCFTGRAACAAEELRDLKGGAAGDPCGSTRQGTAAGSPLTAFYRAGSSGCLLHRLLCSLRQQHGVAWVGEAGRACACAGCAKRGSAEGAAAEIAGRNQKAGGDGSTGIAW